jgi:3-oxoacyl-[acyl-carrier protein] reductase
MKRCCVITGASQGLGRELARAFWIDGWNLLLVSRSPLDETMEALGHRTGQVVYPIAADLGEAGAAERIISEVATRTERIDVLINNAAIQGPVGPAWTGDWNLWEATFRINLLAPIELCRAVLPEMIRNGGGSIINLSGGGAAGPRPNFSAYAAAKAALVRFSETLAAETKAHGILVNCVAPGAMNTAMLRSLLDLGPDVIGRQEHAAAAKVVAGRGGAQDAVSLCLFLASSEAAGITGKLISAVWDDWSRWPEHRDALAEGDLYTLRRITARDRGLRWGDK